MLQLPVAKFSSATTSPATAWAAMMQSCDVVITCLPTPAASAEVVEKMLPSVGPGKIWMEMSTTDADEVARLAEEVHARGGEAVLLRGEPPEAEGIVAGRGCETGLRQSLL